MKGSYITKGAWWASLYLLCLIIIFMIYIIRSLIKYLNQHQEVTLHNIATTSLYITSTVQLIMNCILNINTSTVIIVLKHFDYAEKAIPRMNTFLYNSNNINLTIHLCEIVFMLSLLLVKYKDTFSLDIYFMIMFNIASNFSIYQFCIMMNMISSYGNVLNIHICQYYKIHDYLHEKINATNYMLKKFIFQYASFDKPSKINASSIETLNINIFVKINEKLLDNLTVINNRFNVIVSIYISLLIYFSSSTFIHIMYCSKRAYYNNEYCLQLLFGPLSFLFHLITGISRVVGMVSANKYF